MHKFISFVVALLTAQTYFGQTVASLTPGGSDDSRPLYRSVIGTYHSQVDGLSLVEIVRRAFDTNGDIKIARLEVEKAKARLMQAQVRPNPNLEIEQSTGSLVGSPGDRELNVGVSVPLEVYGQRSRRIDLANAEIGLREAEVSARQRELAKQIFVAYAEALAALQELKVLEELLDLDSQTVQFVQIRVNEGESAPLELNLLQTEVERIRARRQLVEGKLQASISQLKFYAGLSYEEPLKLVEDVSTAAFPLLPPTIETGIGIGLTNRPEIRVAQLDEQLASAGLRLIRSQSRPDLSATARYTNGRAILDDPRGAFSKRDQSLTFGLSIELPIFNRNQGAKAEAAIAIRQAQERRAFAEKVVRNEIVRSFQRMEAAKRALITLETAVLPRSRENINTIRKVYEIGQLKITDLIAEQRKLLEANRDLTETLTERYQAQADLFVALGLTLEK